MIENHASFLFTQVGDTPVCNLVKWLQDDGLTWMIKIDNIQVSIKISEEKRQVKGMIDYFNFKSYPLPKYSSGPGLTY